jgi:CheY-like chemotaxis protein
MTAKKILSVGQCNMDHGSISSVLKGLGAEVTRAHTAADAIKCLEGGEYSLVLVNRVFDADGDSGLALIRKVKAEVPDQPVMLVSNFADAQAEAQAAGALPGFGKAALGRPETLEALKGYV